MSVTPTGSDAELLPNYARHQDDGQFAEIVRRHIQWVYNLALRQLRDPANAEDATQAVFILLLRKANGFSGDRPLAGWLYKSTMLICHDIRRQRRRRMHHEYQAAQMRPITSNPTVVSDLSQQLDVAIGRLRQADREAILMRYFQGLSHDEIALSLAVSQEAVKMRLSRAVGKLRDILTSAASPVSALTVENMLGQNRPAIPADLTSRVLSGGSRPAGLLAKAAAQHLIAAKIPFAAAAILAAGTCGSLAVVGRIIGAQVGRAPVPAAPAVVRRAVVPRGPIGVYFIAGQVRRPGVYQLLGQRSTLRQAILLSGGLDQAVTANTFVAIIHRLPNHTEEISIYRYQSIMQEDPELPGVYPLDRNITINDTISVGLDAKIFATPIHALDMLLVAVANADQPRETIDMRLNVSPQGKVSLPQVGEVDLLGKTMPAAEQVIRAAYAKANVIPSALVSVARLESK